MNRGEWRMSVALLNTVYTITSSVHLKKRFHNKDLIFLFKKIALET